MKEKISKQSKSEYHANRLREVLTEGDWVTGTNFKAQILTIHWERAVESIHGLNSVAQLTFHIHYYISGVTKVLQGGGLEISDKYSFDAPEITSEEDWLKLVDQFCEDAEQFILLVDGLTENELQEVFVEEKYSTVERNLDMMIEHCYYHLGQVVLIKKLQELSPN